METIRFNIMDGLTYNNIINAMKEMVDKEMYKNFPSFNKNEYCWKIGFEVLRRLKAVNPMFRGPSEIDEIRGIKVRTILYHPDDTSKICLIKDCADDMKFEYSNRRLSLNPTYKLPRYNLLTEIKNVIFNDPATIVFWDDGTKTVVKAEGEPFDPEKGLAMAIAKKALGNKGDYYNEFKKWLPEKSDIIVKEEFKSCSECKYKYTHIWQTPCKNCYNNGRPNWEKKND